MAEPAEESVTLRQWTDVVRRARLGRTTKSVALILATYADNDGSRVFPGVARLAVDCELTYNVIQTALKALRDAGLIEVVRRASRRGQADEYRLILADDVLDRVEVLTPTQVAKTATRIAEQRRGRHRPTTPAGAAAEPVPDEIEGDLHPTGSGADNTDEPNLQTGASGAGLDYQLAAAPHGDVRAAAPAPHRDVHLHPTESPPTTHGPQHHLHHPSDENVRTDLAVVGAGGTDGRSGDAADQRCAHGLDGRSRVRCPACHRGLGAHHTEAGAAAARPALRLVRSA